MRADRKAEQGWGLGTPTCSGEGEEKKPANNISVCGVGGKQVNGCPGDGLKGIY